MKKTTITTALLLTTAALMFSAAATAQSRSGRAHRYGADYSDVRLFEFEIGVGGNVGLSGSWHEQGSKSGDTHEVYDVYGGYGGRAGVSLYFEPRFNIPRSPISVGMQLSFGLAGDLHDVDLYYSGHSHVSLYYVHREDMQITYSGVAFADYNWRNWRHVSMFAGLGVGIAKVEADYNRYYEGSDGNPYMHPSGGGPPYHFWSTDTHTARPW